jgi:AcrR family transcriptional regulator
MTIKKRTEGDKQGRYRKILSVAEIIFIRDGYTVTTMDSIAEKAELSKDALYLYFQNKEQLFYSILENKVDIYVNKLKTDLPSAISLNDLVERIVNHQLNFLSENKHLFQLAIFEQCEINKVPASILQKIYTNKQSKFYTLIETYLIKFISITASYSAKTLALSIIGTTNSYMVHWLLTNQEQNLSDLKHEIVLMYFNGINK